MIIICEKDDVNEERNGNEQIPRREECQAIVKACLHV